MMKKIRMMLCGVLTVLMLAGCGAAGECAIVEVGYPTWHWGC